MVIECSDTASPKVGVQMGKHVFVLVLLLVSLSLTACGTAVPDVRGMSVVQAEEVLASAGFEVGQVTYDEDAEGALGAVMSQNPEAGKSADEGSLVTLTVAGPAPVTTPDISGLDREQAQIALSAVGLALGDVSESHHATASAGVITSQTPAAGVDAPRDSEVTVVVSKGPEPVAVPDVVGRTIDEARSALDDAGFTTKETDVSDSAAAGTVLSQSPSSGTEAQPGTEVELSVSSGVEMLTVPDFVQMEQDMWSSWSGGPYPADLLAGRIRDAGFTAKVIKDNDRWVWDSYQDPRAGTKAPRGSLVTVVLGQNGE